MMGCVPGRYWDGAIRDCAGMRGMSPRFYSSAFRSYRVMWSGVRGTTRAPYCANVAPSALFPFLEKKEGRKKSLGQQTHGKRTHRIFSVLSA